jgi:sugar/nucleoside kinase (ribokinase family)
VTNANDDPGRLGQLPEPAASDEPGRDQAMSVDPLAAVRAPQDPTFDVFLTGTVFLDIVLTGLQSAPAVGTEVWAEGMGSCPGGIANLAIATSRLGLHTAVAAAFGDDVYGDFCWESLAVHEGVDLSLSRRVPGWHSPVTVSMAYAGERTMVTHGHPAPPGEPIPAAIPRARTSVVQLAPGRREPWIEQASREGSLIFADVGWDETNTWATDVLDDLRFCHAFLPNAAEATRYTRTDTPQEAVRRLAEMVPVAVVTDGANGAVAIDGTTGEFAEVPGLHVPALDPTGAGDVFVAAFVTGTVAEWPLIDRLLFANLAAALSVQDFGGSLAAPGWLDVASWLWQIKRDPTAADLAARYRFLDKVVPPIRPQPLRRAVPTIGFREQS